MNLDRRWLPDDLIQMTNGYHLSPQPVAARSEMVANPLSRPVQLRLPLTPELEQFAVVNGSHLDYLPPQFPYLLTQQRVDVDSLPQVTEPLGQERYIPDPFHWPIQRPPEPEEVALSDPYDRDVPIPSYEDNVSIDGLLNASGDSWSADDDDDNEAQPQDDATRSPQSTTPSDVYEDTRTRRGPGRPRKAYAHLSRRTGHRGGWSKGQKLGPRPNVEPSEEWHELHQQAWDAHVYEHDAEKALDLVNQAIAVNPEIYAGHKLLSDIRFSLGRDHEQSAIGALWIGAHTCPADPDVWKQFVSAVRERTSYDRRIALNQEKYAVTILSRLERDHLDWRFQRARIDLALEKPQKAVNDVNPILWEQPHNSDALALRAYAWCDLGRVQEAINQYKEEIAHFLDVGLDGEDTFEWKDVKTYVDVLVKQAGAERTAFAIRTLKKLARWLLGRRHETFWDDIDVDDREFDANDSPRRDQVDGFVAGRWSEHSYGVGLPLELRVQLGLLRFRQGGFREEALAHFEWLEADEHNQEMIEQYWDLYRQVGLALSEAKEHVEALRYLEAVYHTEEAHNHDYWIAMGEGFYMCGKKDAAMEFLQAALDCQENSVEARTHMSLIKTNKGDYHEALADAKDAVEIALDLIPKTGNRKYERREQRLAREAAERALRQADRLANPPPPKLPRSRQRDRRRKRPKSDSEDDEDFDDDLDNTPDNVGTPTNVVTPTQPSEEPTFIPVKPKRKPPNRITPRQLPVKEEDKAALQERIKRLFTTLESCTEAMRAGDTTAKGIWMDCAAVMVQTFRENRAFFPRREKDGTIVYGNKRSHREAVDQPPPSINLTFSADWSTLPVESNLSPTTFYGVTLDSWLPVLLEYAVLLTQSTSPTAKRDCYAVLNSATDCIAWHNSLPALTHIHICYLSCSLAFHDQNTLFNTVLRWFMTNHIFSSHIYSLIGTMNLFFPYPNHKQGKAGQVQNGVYRSGPFRKLLFQQVAGLDQSLHPSYNPTDSGPVPDFMRQTREEVFTAHCDDGYGNKVLVRPSEMNTVLLVLYGQICYANGNFTSALSYFYRARSIDPKNALVLLSISLAYMHQVFKKVNEDRHMYVLQGWAFFEEYAEARGAWAEGKDDGTGELMREVEREIEFNRARCWQMLGMEDVATRCYWAVVRRFEEVEMGMTREDSAGEDGADGGEGDSKAWKMQAAYALASTYAMNGDAATAREITEKYLVVE